MKNYHSLLIIVLAFTMSSCALMFNPTQEKVLFNSKPTGMSVLINDSLYGKTPLITSLSKKKDYAIKYKYLDSLVYSDSIKSKVYIGYIIMDLFFPTNILIFTAPLPFLVDGISQSYKGLNKNIISFTHSQTEVLSDSILKTNQNEKLVFKNDKALRQHASLLEDNKCNIHTKNGKVRKNYKIMGLEDDKYLICSLNNLYEYDPQDFRKLITTENEKEYVLIDSIDTIVIEDPMTDKGSFTNTLLGFVIGAGSGLGIAFMAKPKPKEFEVLIPIGLGAAGGILGGIIGLSANSTDYNYYYFSGKNHEQKVDMLKQMLLMK